MEKIFSCFLLVLTICVAANGIILTTTNMPAKRKCGPVQTCFVSPCDPNLPPRCKKDENCVERCPCVATCEPKKCPSPPKLCIISPCDPRVFPCKRNEQCQEKCSCEPTCSRCPFKLTACKRNPCHTSANICPKKTSVCEANYCGGCNVVCRPKPTPTEEPLKDCWVDPKKPKEICLQVLTTFCTKKCKKCCQNRNSCIPNKKFSYRKDGKKCIAPPLLPCIKDGSSDGKICTQAFQVFCKRGCKKCCLNNNGCTPSIPYRFTKSGNGKCLARPKPLPQCKKTSYSDGKLCAAVITTFCKRGCIRCCRNNNGCPPSRGFRYKKINGKCIPPPPPPPPSPAQCIEARSRNPYQICGQAITTFCDRKCRCCKHRNTCNPNPKRYVKSSRECAPNNPCPFPPKQCFAFPCSPSLNPCSKDETCTQDCNCRAVCKPKSRCPKGCTPIVCATYPCSGCSCPA